MTDLKPEDRALIERKLVLAIIAASHQQPMTSPTAVSDVLSTPQVRAAIDALATSLSDPTGEVGGVETGWLIEEFSTKTNEFKARWWNGEAFTKDSNDAMRFCLRRDAQRYIDDIGWTEAVPTEHQWVRAPASPSIAPKLSDGACKHAPSNCADPVCRERKACLYAVPPSRGA